MSSRLSSLLVHDGRVTAKRMADAFQRQVIFGGSLDTVLLEMSLIEEPLLNEYLAQSSGLPLIARPITAGAGSPPAQAVGRGYTRELAERHRAVPIAWVGDRLEVLVTDPVDEESLRALGETLGAKVEARVAADVRYQEGLFAVFGASMPARAVKLIARLRDKAAQLAAASLLAPAGSVEKTSAATPPAAAGAPAPSTATASPTPAVARSAPSLIAVAAPKAAVKSEPAPVEKAPVKPETAGAEKAAVKPLSVAPATTAVKPEPSTRPAPGVRAPSAPSVSPAHPVMAQPARAAAGDAKPASSSAPPSVTPSFTAPVRPVSTTLPSIAGHSAFARRGSAPSLTPTVTPVAKPVESAPAASAPEVASPGAPVEHLTGNTSRSRKATLKFTSNPVAARQASSMEGAGSTPATGSAAAPADGAQPATGSPRPATGNALSAASAAVLVGLSDVSPAPRASARPSPLPMPTIADLAPDLFEDDFVLPPDPVAAVTSPADADYMPATLGLDAGLAALQAAGSRDAVFEILCKMARSRFAFVAIFSVAGESASARMALGPAWFDRGALDGASIDLRQPSALSVAVQTLAPFVGRVGEDAALGQILRFVGRPAPLLAALLPVVLKGRAMAVLYLDDDGRAVAADELSELTRAAAEAARAFLRLVKARKDQGQSQLATAAAGDAPERAQSAVARSIASSPPPRVSPSATGAGASSSASRGGRDAAGEAGIATLDAELPPARAQQKFATLGYGAFEQLLDAVERGEPTAATAATYLVASGVDGARATVKRLPGPLRFGGRNADTATAPLAEHGPLVALCARFGATIVPFLVPLLDGSSPELRFHATLILGEIGDERAVPALGARLYDDDSDVRVAVAVVLSRFPHSAPLLALLDDLRHNLLGPDAARVVAATVAVGELRDSFAIPPLIELLKHPSQEVTEAARRALLTISKQDFGWSRWRWRSWWESSRGQSRLTWLLAGLEQPTPAGKRSAAEELSAIKGARFGVHGTLGQEERDEGAQRFAAWYKLNPDALTDGT